MPSISVVVPTCGRPTLQRALESVRPQMGTEDEIIVVGDGKQPSARRTVVACNDKRIRYFEHGPTAFWGNAQRNFGTQLARGAYIAFLDDDDFYSETALSDIRKAAVEYPGQPMMFRIRFHDPPFLKWREPVFADENISGGSFVVPNVPERIAVWPTPEEAAGRPADRVFIEDTLRLWPENSLVWRSELFYHVPKASINAP
jgi:glycosyltransferase involved in cell wall biosynthesis